MPEFLALTVILMLYIGNLILSFNALEVTGIVDKISIAGKRCLPIIRICIGTLLCLTIIRTCGYKQFKALTNLLNY